jgi:hypothetical protein
MRQKTYGITDFFSILQPVEAQNVHLYETFTRRLTALARRHTANEVNSPYHFQLVSVNMIRNCFHGCDSTKFTKVERNNNNNDNFENRQPQMKL